MAPGNPLPVHTEHVRPRADPSTSGDLMFDHVVFGVSDYAASKAFFLKALEPLGVAVVLEGPLGIVLSPNGTSSLCLFQTEEKPSPPHLAFTAENRMQVDAFHRAALPAAGTYKRAPTLPPHDTAHTSSASTIGTVAHNYTTVFHTLCAHHFSPD